MPLLLLTTQSIWSTDQTPSPRDASTLTGATPTFTGEGHPIVLGAGAQGLPTSAELSQVCVCVWLGWGAWATGARLRREPVRVRAAAPGERPGWLWAKVGVVSHRSKRTDTRSMATITDSLSGVAGLGSEVRPGLIFSFPETNHCVLLLALKTAP